MALTFDRRELLMLALAAGLEACARSTTTPDGGQLQLPAQTPSNDLPVAPQFADSLDALFDLILPAEMGPGGVMSPGAREAGVDEVLELHSFARLAMAQGFIGSVDENLLTQFDDLGSTGRAAANALLDARAQLERPGTTFAKLERESQLRIVAAAFDDDATRPLMLIVRAACFTAYLGAVSSDLGLQEVGLPAFENFEQGVAGLGYPRMVRGQVDDYTFNRQPAATVGDDLSLVLTPEGDLR